MSKDNSDFFKEKKDWSIVKDDLLASYLTPYFQKIFSRKNALYIDCFAGKGIFDDGEFGSPLIALSKIKDRLDYTKFQNVKVSCIFIEERYADILTENLYKYFPNDQIKIEIISGKYEKEIKKALSDKRNFDVFLYLDPFGIKSLNFSIFEHLTTEKFKSLEILINLNSFGYIRAACSAKNIFFDTQGFEAVLENETEILEKPDKLVENLDQVAGGEYWKEIISKYRKNNKIDSYIAEKEFSIQYCNELKKHFKYVLNMPLRIKQDQNPIYRMIYVTNHSDGCVLMNDNMYDRWEESHKGQTKLSKTDLENNQIEDEKDIRVPLLEIIKSNENGIRMNDLYSQFITKYGVRCRTKDMEEQIKILEKQSVIDILRNPAKTKFEKDSTFWKEGHGKTITIKLKKGKGNEKGNWFY